MKYTSFRDKVNREIQARVDHAVMVAAAVYVERVRRAFTKTARGVPAPPGRPPSVQTGDLRRRLYTRHAGPGVARAGSNLAYARVQELGGTIYGKNGKLAIPIGAKGRKLAKMAGGNLRSLNLKLVVVRGTSMLFENKRGKSKGGKGQLGPPVFVLKASVSLPPRSYLRPMLRIAAKDMQRAFTRAMQAGGAA